MDRPALVVRQAKQHAIHFMPTTHAAKAALVLRVRRRDPDRQSTGQSPPFHQNGPTKWIVFTSVSFGCGADTAPETISSLNRT